VAAASSRRIAAARLGVYETLHELASGGMATVSIARHAGAAGFERLVVIKRVHPHLLKDRAFSDMFRDEARVCSTIRHPNVVPVIDVVESDGELYLVLEYVESLSLAALLRAAAGERLPPAVASRILSDALAGLHAAHEAVDMRGNPLGLIHRDVSPQNIVVGLDGSSRLIDFGIAKAASRITSTESGVLKGKLRYMAPEQVQRKPLDRRADVFAAGEVLYEALTGQRAFPGDDTGDIVVGLLIGGVEPPTSLAPELPPAIDAVLEKALARSRDERFSTAAALQEALEHAIPPAPAREVAAVVERLGGARLRERREALREALHAGSAAGPAAPTTSNDAILAAPAPAPVAPHPRRRGWLVAAALLVVLAVVAAVGLRLRATAAPTAKAATQDDAPSAAVAVVPPALPPSPSVAATESASAAASAPPPRIAPPARPRPNANPELHRRNPYGSR
jgi:serine/threonine-protein kinase